MRIDREGLTAAPIRQNTLPRKVNTLEGKETLNVKICLCCGELKPITEFYQHGEGKASTSKDKKGKLRSQCVTCYDLFKGRYPTPFDNYEPSNNLESFMK